MHPIDNIIGYSLSTWPRKKPIIKTNLLYLSPFIIISHSFLFSLSLTELEFRRGRVSSRSSCLVSSLSQILAILSLWILSHYLHSIQFNVKPAKLLNCATQMSFSLIFLHFLRNQTIFYAIRIGPSIVFEFRYFFLNHTKYCLYF